MPRVTALFLVLAALAWGDSVDLISSMKASRSALLVGEWTYEVWNAGAPAERGELRVSGVADGQGGVSWGEALRLPDVATHSLWTQESLALGSSLAMRTFVRSVTGGDGEKAVEMSRLEATWGNGDVSVVRNGGKPVRLAGDVLPDAILPPCLTLLALDRSKEYRCQVMSYAGTLHAAAAKLVFDGEAQSGGKAYARWSLRLLREDPTQEWKWWMDADGHVVRFRSGSYEGGLTGGSWEALPLDGDLDPKVLVTVSGEKVKDSGQGTPFTFEDATYRRGAWVALKSKYTGEESAHGRVMDVQGGDRVVVVLRHYDLGNAAVVGQAWSLTLAVALPGLQEGRSYELGKEGGAEGILHFGASGSGQEEMVSRVALGTCKVIRASGPTLELELALTFEGFFTGAKVGKTRIEIRGSATALITE